MRVLQIVVALGLAATSLQAQADTLRVLRHAPADTASPGNLVTVTFDRPVAGRLDQTVEAASILRIEPAIRGRIGWRDPVTIRVVPDEPLPPGAEYTVTVDTAFRAIDGSRLERPFRFSFRVPGPRLLAQSFGGGYSSAPIVLPVDGTMRLLYSAPIDLEALQRGLRLGLPGCRDGGSQHALRVVGQRMITSDDPYQFTNAGGWDRDTVADRFRRVVELEPATPLPENCEGSLVVPTTADDARHGHEERHVVRTAPPFRLTFDCSRIIHLCSMDYLTLSFTAPVRRGDVQRFVRLEPAVPLELVGNAPEAAQWLVKLEVKPRTTYTVVIDEAMRDVHGRTLMSPRRAQVAIRTSDSSSWPMS